MRLRGSTLLSATLCLLAFAGLSRAGTITIVEQGNIPAGTLENVVFNGTGVVTTGNPVIGRGNDSGILFDFLGTETLKATASGQAAVSSNGDSSINTLEFTVHGGGTFTTLSFQVDFYDPPGKDKHGVGTITIEAFELGGGSVSKGFAIGDNDQSAKYYTIAGDLKKLTKVTISSTIALDSVREFRVNGAAKESHGTIPVPLPASGWGGLALLGGLVVQRKLRRSAV